MIMVDGLGQERCIFEILASLESENPKSLIFNILITDPDKKNPEEIQFWMK